MLPLQSVQNGMDLNLLFLILQPYLILCHCFISLYCAPYHTLFASHCYQQQQQQQLPVRDRPCPYLKQIL